MKEMKLLAAMGWVRDEYIAEMMEPGRKRVPKRTLWLIAAIVSVTLLLTGCAAVILLRLENLTLHQTVTYDDVPESTWVYTPVSMQGLAGTPNFRAAKEWLEFLETYDEDHSIIQSMPRDEMDQGEEYYSYNCYTPEMARKIDEICEKYNLQKQGMPQHEQSFENICHVLPLGNLSKDSPNVKFLWDSGYIYRSGTFMMEGDVEFGPEDRVGFQFYCASKKDFDDVYMNIGDPEQYEQWTVTAADGQEVLLVMGPEDAILMADREEAFISMSFHVFYDREISRAELEEIAGLLDLSFGLHPLTDEQWQYLEENKVEWKRPTPGVYEGSSYSERVRILLEGFDHVKDWGYVLMDVDGDSSQDLVIGKDGFVCMIFTTDGETVYVAPPSCYLWDIGENVFGDPAGYNLLPSYGYVCEGNKVLFVYERRDGITVYQIAGVVDGKLNWIDLVTEDPAQNAWHRFPVDPGQPGYREPEPITKEEFEEVLNACVPIELEMTPLVDFPLDETE